MSGRMYMGIPREQIPWAPTVDPDACVACGECLDTCPNEVFVLNAAGDSVEVANPNNCVVLCDKCAGFCSQEAISFPDVDEFKKVLRHLLENLRKPHVDPS